MAQVMDNNAESFEVDLYADKDADVETHEIGICGSMKIGSEPIQPQNCDLIDIDSLPPEQQNWDTMEIDSGTVQNDETETRGPMGNENGPALLRRDDNVFLNTTQIDNQDTTSLTLAKTTSQHNAFGRHSRGNQKLKRVKTGRDGVKKMSSRKPKYKLEMSAGLDAKQRVLAHHEKRQSFEVSEKDVEKIAKRKSARVTSLYHRLIGHEPLDSFAENCEKTIPDWISLLRKTALPGLINSSHPSIVAAFKAVDLVICGTQGTYLLRRLAYVQLMRLFVSLEALIKSERESGKFVRKQGFGDASIAIDIYMSAQQSHLHPDDLRRELKERRRAGRVWRDLSGPSPLFTMVYSQASESIMYEQHPPSHRR
ncbi:hypothetical protein NW762_012855 [Fusarium torreyae]|uniref:Uncharacterized protein n=1 Tax=Fusarium torreyae TaxID=1237075 RepID=A0A9W8RPB0_9HYPO|nr:hypothetical protein NW762_012855 [Fusarium torreyae]